MESLSDQPDDIISGIPTLQRMLKAKMEPSSSPPLAVEWTAIISQLEGDFGVELMQCEH